MIFELPRGMENYHHIDCVEIEIIALDYEDYH